MTNLCLNCQHWVGDKAHMLEMMAENPLALDRNRGWAETAGCARSYEWAQIDVYGNAVAALEVPANFYCNRFEADDE